jgi:hypothetical protein
MDEGFAVKKHHRGGVARGCERNRGRGASGGNTPSTIAIVKFVLSFLVFVTFSSGGK